MVESRPGGGGGPARDKRAAASEVGILARRPREYRRWEITQASHHPQRPFTLNIAPQGPDRHGRKYLPGRNVVQEPSNCQTRVSLDRKWLARLRLPQGLGAVLPTAPRTPCNSSVRSPLGLQFPANLAAPSVALPTSQKQCPVFLSAPVHVPGTRPSCYALCGGSALSQCETLERRSGHIRVICFVGL